MSPTRTATSTTTAASTSAAPCAPLYDDVRHKGPLQGGSTITQQYVKLAFTNQQRTLVRKVREAILASQLDREASKNEILYRYLTLVYFGDGNYGIGAAAENYFHVPVSALNASQAATLAGLIPAPSARAPRENLAAAEAHRELVLKEMHQQGYLTAGPVPGRSGPAAGPGDDGHTLPPHATVVYPLERHNHRLPRLRRLRDPLAARRTSRPRRCTGVGCGCRPPWTRPCRPTPTPRCAPPCPGPVRPLDMALAAVEPSTGFVPALVGGRGFGTDLPRSTWPSAGAIPAALGGAIVQVAATCWSGQTITGGGEGRQPGSAWKPFTLATAFEQGIQPGAAYSAPGVYQIPGCKVPAGQPAERLPDPQRRARQRHRHRDALARRPSESTNTVYAQVAPQVGCNNVAATAKKLGIDSAYYSTPPFYYCQSYALGELDVSPLDMASAYGVFADHGQRATPTPILEIVNSAGKVLVNNIKPAADDDDRTAGQRGRQRHQRPAGCHHRRDRHGRPARTGPAAGKTGTTSNYTNAWFVGYTPTLSAAVWMGNANSQATPMGDGQRRLPGLRRARGPRSPGSSS